MLAGSCHCGAVRFRVDASIAELTTCDCSLCVKRNAVMAKVAEKDLTVLEGEAMLTLYEWNTRRASAPNHFGINAFCLENFDAASVPIRATQGTNMSVEDPATISDSQESDP